jgi:type IX secretion system PorP/SprF family membrane protein
MRRLFTFAITLLIGFSGLQAQDIHFSQFWASPMTLNPALTGFTPCTWRASVNYRNQWGSIVGPSSFQTYSGSFDAGLFKGALRDNMIGIGAVVFNDRSGDGVLSNLSALASLAYHQSLGSDKHYLSLGFQAGMVQKRVDISKFIFENNIGPNGVDPGLTSGEVFDNTSFLYLDMNAGVHISSRITKNFQVSAGGAYFHIGEPVEEFLTEDGTENILNSRYLAHAGMKIGIKDKVVILPHFLYMTQTEGSNKEMLYGSSLGFALGQGSGSFFYLGGYYRHDDAVIASTGVDFKNLSIGFSYDINVSDLQAVSGSKGGLEVSLSYYGCLETKTRTNVLDCPRF